MSIAVELLNKLTTCLAKSEAEDVDLESYVDLWSDLGTVLAVMGSVFKFVKSDVDDKGTPYYNVTNCFINYDSQDMT